MFVATQNVNSPPNVRGQKKGKVKHVYLNYLHWFYGNIDVLLKNHDTYRLLVSYKVKANHADVRKVPFEVVRAAVFLYAYSVDSRLFTTLNNHVTW